MFYRKHSFTYFLLRPPQIAVKQVRNACTLCIPTSGPTLWAPPVASTKSLAADNATQIQESVTERLSARLAGWGPLADIHAGLSVPGVMRSGQASQVGPPGCVSILAKPYVARMSTRFTTYLFSKPRARTMTQAPTSWVLSRSTCPVGTPV